MNPFAERDRRLRFDADSHRYWVDGTEYRSVTTLVGDVTPPFDAEQVIAKNWPNWHKPGGRYPGMSPHAIADKWRLDGEAARDAGHALHQQIQTFFETGRPADTPTFRQFLALHRHLGGAKPARTEWAIYSTRYRVAGTLDALYRDKDGFVLRDWKLSKAIKTENRYARMLEPLGHLEDCNMVHYSLQLHLYKHLLETEYGLHPIRPELVHFKPGGSYQIYRVKPLAREAADLLAAHAARHA